MSLVTNPAAELFLEVTPVTVAVHITSETRAAELIPEVTLVTNFRQEYVRICTIRYVLYRIVGKCGEIS